MRWTEQALLLTVLISIAGLCCQAEAVQWVQVKWVNDGDTVVLKDGRTLRYIGINTPEIDYKRNRAEPYANAARQFNRKLVSGVPVRIEFERKKTDQYGRLLAYLFLKDDTFVNRQLLVKGYGYFLPTSQAGKYDVDLLQAQREAMTVKTGIWKGWCEPYNPTGYIANHRSKRFHLTHCTNAKKISRKNRVSLETMWAALEKGYVPAKGCINHQLGWRAP